MRLEPDQISLLAKASGEIGKPTTMEMKMTNVYHVRFVIGGHTQNREIREMERREKGEIVGEDRTKLKIFTGVPFWWTSPTKLTGIG